MVISAKTRLFSTATAFSRLLRLSWCTLMLKMLSPPKSLFTGNRARYSRSLLLHCTEVQCPDGDSQSYLYLTCPSLIKRIGKDTGHTTVADEVYRRYK